ncbi:Conserved oligomeric Golgi complex subunit 6 [Cytospora mali]|uniref:Conserved oligomeric Golgi complex subunit 6 n=1 Tax=Cytospora mali TaxID=578113 RepID=A0A194VE08_CYTMA|nr:Conserved oligomeric Golgi complex subunit 6 [Valsa mali var. pyri (nom. inval.)]
MSSESPISPAHVPSSSFDRFPGSVPQTPTTASSFKGSNPFSSKVTAVLATSYADSEFRDALSLLDDRGISNSAATRRQVRLQLQKEVIDSNGDIIAEFGRVSDQLRRIGATITKLNRSYDEMKAHISAAHESTAPVIRDASSLMTQRHQVETKQHLLGAFNRYFILSEDELAALTSTAEPVDDLFFTVLSKAKKIRKDCEILLGFENQALGLEIMEQTSKNLNLAFQKLYRWIQREFKTLNLENPQMGSPMRRALRVLAERPSLFQNCLDLFAETREQVLSDSFYTALTGSSSSGIEDRSVKPIELAAHDPLRYVGDMLAWMHSAAVSERESLEILFLSEGDEIAKGIKAGRENEIWRLVDEDEDGGSPAFDPVQALNELVDRDMSGAARVLRQRVEQVIQTNEEVILAYKLANLLNFYRVTFSKLLSTESVLVESLQGLEAEALRQFRSLMRDYVGNIQGEFQHTPASLEPPEFLYEALEQLSAVMKTYDTSLTSTESREADFQPILAEAFDPFISGCQNMAKNLETPSDSIFSINCAQAAINALSSFDFARGRSGELQEQVDEHSRALVDHQYAFFKRESGLESALTALEPLTDKKEDIGSMRMLEPFQPASLELASRTLDNFLASALMDAMENIQALQDSRVAREITEEAAERFCADFGRLEDMLMSADEMAELEGSASAHDGEQDIQSLRTVFPRTADEIRVLLS